MNVFFSTMLYALGKDLGIEGAIAEFLRQLEEPDTDSLNVVRTLGRLRTLAAVGIYQDNTATCIAKARSRAFHAAHQSEADVWISCDDDVECTLEVLNLLLDATVAVTPRIAFVPTTLRGNEQMASVKFALAGALSSRSRSWSPIVECGAGLFCANRAALDTLARGFDHLKFRDHDGVQKVGLFVETIDNGEWVGEDIAFCRRAALAGVDLVGITAGHSRHGNAAPLDLRTIAPRVIA